MEVCDGMRNVNRSMYDCYSFWLEKKDIHAIYTTTVAFSDLIGEDYDPECDFGIISCLISELPDFIVRDGTSIVLQKWKEPVENGTIISEIESCDTDKKNILDYFSKSDS